jgi:hypothetical protein
MSPPPPPPTILLLHFEYACRHRTQARTHLNIIYLALTRSFFKKNLRSNWASKALTKVLQKQYFVGWWSIDRLIHHCLWPGPSVSMNDKNFIPICFVRDISLIIPPTPPVRTCCTNERLASELPSSQYYYIIQIFMYPNLCFTRVSSIAKKEGNFFLKI